MTVLEKEATPGGRCNQIVRDGHRFDIGPTLFLMPEVWEETFASLGEKMSDHLDLRRIDPTYKVYFDDGLRLELTSNIERAVPQRRVHRQDLAVADMAHGASLSHLVAFDGKGYIDVHHLGLEGIEDVQAALDEVRDELPHVPAGVVHDRQAETLGLFGDTPQGREDELPAHPREVREAREEGINFKLGTAPIAFEGTETLERVVCRAAHWQRQEDGSLKIAYDNEETFSLEADCVIVAIGQRPQLNECGLDKEIKLGPGGRARGGAAPCRHRPGRPSRRGPPGRLVPERRRDHTGCCP